MFFSFSRKQWCVIRLCRTGAAAQKAVHYKTEYGIVVPHVAKADMNAIAAEMGVLGGGSLAPASRIYINRIICGNGCRFSDACRVL
jgi:hypothetical protein